MRILHVIYDDIENPWLGGGGAVRTLEIYSRIARSGHRVQVVCGSYPGAPRRRIRRGVYYRHVGLPGPYALSRLSFMLEAARLIKRGGYDIVIEDVSPFSPVGAPMWSQHTPTVASVQNLFGTHATRKYGLRGIPTRLVEKPLHALFRNFIAVSDDVAAHLYRTLGYGINVRVVRYSANQVFFDAGEAPASEQSDYILYVGRIDVYQKGLDRLVEAFDQLAGRMPGVRLLIVGSGAESQVALLRSLMSRSRHGGRMTMHGHRSQEETARLMKGAMFVAIPSRYETGPLTALEAGAAGVPVVGTNIANLRDNAPQYPRGHGELVREGDVGALARAMLKLAGDAPLRRAMGEMGRRWSSQFTWDALAKRQLGFYEELV